MPQTPPSSAQAIQKGLCPVCRSGYMFAYPLTKFTKFSVMNPTCPNCQVNFTPEPGFYYGSMYISYAINVALFIATFAALNLFTDLKGTDLLLVLLPIMVVLVLLTFPFLYRISRSFYLHTFGPLRFKPEKYTAGPPKRNPSPSRN